MRKHFLLIFSLLLLTACNDSMSYDDLMLHPKVLTREVERCQSLEAKIQNTARCELVMRAAIDFSALVEEQQAAPESFGEKIMQLETAYVNCKSQREKECQQEALQIKKMLAVISLGAPE